MGIMKLSGRDKSPHNAYNWDIRYMMISTWGATGDWRIGEPSPKPEIKLEVLQTPNQHKYLPVESFDASAGEVTFEVKARNDVHIALGEDNLHNGKIYEIVLGGWGNTQSVIRGRNQGSNLVTYRAVVLNYREYTKFRLSWDKTMLKVERESGDSWTMIMKLSGRDKSPHNAYNWDIRYMMISTGWGATGDWRIEKSF